MGLFICGFLLLGCASDQGPGVWPPDPKRVAPTLLLRYIQQNGQQLQDLKARVRLESDFNGQKQRANARLLFKRPAKFLLDIYDPFGTTVLVALFKDQQAQIYIPEDNQLIEHVLTAEDVEAITGIRADLEDFRIALSGEMDLGLADSSAIIDYRLDGSHYLLVLERDSQGQRRYWIHPRRFWLIRGAHYNALGRLLLDAHFRDYRRIDGVWRPMVVEVIKPRVNGRLVIRFRSQDLNTGLSDQAFVFKLPASVRHIRMN